MPTAITTTIHININVPTAIMTIIHININVAIPSIKIALHAAAITVEDMASFFAAIHPGHS